MALGHNACQETGDLTAHAEIVVFRQAAHQLSAMTEGQRKQVTLYTSLEPCLMCFAAASYIGIGRIAFSALYEDGKEDLQIAHHLTPDQLNPLLIRGQIELIPGVEREKGRELLAMMGKAF